MTLQLKKQQKWGSTSTAKRSTCTTASKTQQAAPQPAGNAGSIEIKSSVPGKVIAVEVSQGQVVKAGDTVVILESMKMKSQLLYLRMERSLVSQFHRK